MSPTWTCSTCLVTARFADPDQADPPSTWTAHAAGWRCLGCARQATVDAALAEAGIEPGTKAATAIKRSALSRFELLRDADRTDAQIAKGIGGYAVAVATLRSELLAAGEIHPRSAGPKPRPAVVKSAPKPRPRQRSRFAEPVEAALHRDPQRQNAEIARSVGCDPSTVRLYRLRLERAGEIPKTERRGGRREKAAA